MAAGDITVYNGAKVALMEARMNLEGGTIMVALVTGYSVDIDGDEFWDDVSGDEASGDGYTAGGEELANRSVTQDDTEDEGVFDADDVTWEDLDVGTPSHAIIYRDSGSPSSSPLIAAVELGVASNGQDYTIQWAEGGILRLA